ncbi:MAG: hypothetical protein WC593_15655 [Methanoregula sp.]
MSLSRQDWLKKAQEHDKTAREYYRKDEITMARSYESKADAARLCAMLAEAREER